MIGDWLSGIDDVSFVAFDQVSPQSREFLTQISLCGLLPLPRNVAHATYTTPAEMFCAAGLPPGPAGMVQVAFPRGTSAIVHGLSRNRPDVPLSTIEIRRNRGGTLGSDVLLSSMNVATNCTPDFPSPPELSPEEVPLASSARLKAMPLT